MKKATPPAKRKRAPGGGRKPSDPSGAKRPVSVWLSPAERARAEALGGGSAAAGLVRLLRAAR